MNENILPIFKKVPRPFCGINDNSDDVNLINVANEFFVLKMYK